MPIQSLSGASQLGHNTAVLPLQLDHHAIAAISISGTCLDVLGSLYLAHDLLGGQHGPLRQLTRAGTYSIVFGIGYGIGLGPFLDLASGVASGITVSTELNREARRLKPYSLPWEGVFAAILGCGFEPDSTDSTEWWVSNSPSPLPPSTPSAK